MDRQFTHTLTDNWKQLSP